MVYLHPYLYRHLYLYPCIHIRIHTYLCLYLLNLLLATVLGRSRRCLAGFAGLDAVQNRMRLNHRKV